ncbi:MAG TPA: hypothetical protein VFM71_02525 [Gemmatimonadaceae bacterium]|nr:hypothetical protein [Gemmatimonadaceae bacterium]
MSEDKFEEFLQREAQAYNPPPATAPRDEMWAAIQRSREAARRDIAAAAVSTGATNSTSSRRRARYAPWIGMAATLLIGVGIGRYAMDRGSSSLLQDAPVVVGTESAASDATPGSPLNTDSPDTGAAGVDAPNTRVAGGDAPNTVDAPATRVAAVDAPDTRSVAPSSIDNPAVPATGGRLSPTYEVASQRHLQRAEALVAVVAAAPRDPMMDSLTSLWARDVLTNTRLMLDSPVGDDPIRRRLLEDLENLLVQLVQRSGSPVEERALIDRTLQRTQLLTRLRTSASGT